MEEIMVDAEERSPSYKDVLFKQKGDEEFDETWEDAILDEGLPENIWYKEDPFEEKDQQQDQGPGPVIHVSDEEWAKWSAPWEKSLVVKVMGKKLHF